ncbi:MAG: helix-turn-helix transcriptional regulator [Parasynechococcus sp.]|nr:helix-turn-helix transcriptional regulator [Synechococcus sp. BS307-5m-G36]MBL6880271.1 helix-turn-helix transcriptional regulator [Synechococcus sp. BS30m-G31]MDA7436942.1 helix-turn-helix transcriptional regulator [Synechococcus sp. AH-601-B19]MDG2329030.1 helix-turn-helix transcriptional regulator [Synechococcus sp. cluster2_bin.44]MDP7998770.1 helix-turn-helix transcriptional regulator [Synechococcus sp. SP1 MAG]
MTTETSLTPSEARVSALLLQGMTNRAIADRLVLSLRTVECHISRALSKTGCSTRLELALWMMDRPFHR